jgi:hypothetical protein
MDPRTRTFASWRDQHLRSEPGGALIRSNEPGSGISELRTVLQLSCGALGWARVRQCFDGQSMAQAVGRVIPYLPKRSKKDFSITTGNNNYEVSV